MDRKPEAQTSPQTKARAARKPPQPMPGQGEAVGATPQSAPEAAPGPDGNGRSYTLSLPMMNIELHPPGRPHMPHISRQEVGHMVDTTRTFLPPPERLVYYGGLGALALFGAIEWPVAAAIGVGTMIASRAMKQQRKEEREAR